ncbi:MAG: MBOAT family O-acyltransferase [Anaerotignaceae bacterium]
MASYFFYMCWQYELIILIIISTASNFIISHKIYKSQAENQRKTLLILSLVINFGLLFIFKYLVFINTSFMWLFGNIGINYPIPSFDIILPMGISFYTFQAAAYTIDVYSRKIKPVKSYGIFSLFITFFPQLVAGPIERSANLLPQFYKKHPFRLRNVILGLKIMVWGFFKKVVIADRISIAVETVYNTSRYNSGLIFIFAILLFTVQIYCDFSGYSDIARGSARVLGFNLMENFNRPFFSKSIREFWRRWHVSLSSWFMDYVYIPLGGNRNGKLCQYRNLLITFLVSGLWHGANWTYVLWGGLHGLCIVFENITLNCTNKIKSFFGYEKNKVSTALFDLVSMVFTFCFVAVAFTLFWVNSIEDAFYIFTHLLWDFRSFATPQYLYETITSMGINIYELKIILTGILVLALSEIFIGKNLYKPLPWFRGIVGTIYYGFLIVFILTAGVFYNAGAFIYFQF